MRGEPRVVSLFTGILAASALLGLFGTSACKRAAPTATCHRPDDRSVVACVDGVAVTRAQVESYVREPWWKPGSSVLPDPRREAAGRACRATLFVAEARRRKLTLPAGAPDSNASWVQALMADVASKAGISRDAISDAEAERQYRENQELYNQIDRVDAQVIVFSDAASAMKVYPEAAAADEGAFRGLVAKHSIDEKTKANGGDRIVVAADDEDHTVLKIVLSFPKPGSVFSPFKAVDGRWYLLRIKASPVEHPRLLDAEMKASMKNVLVEQRRNKALDELEASLRAGAKIEIFDDALATVAVPKFE